MACIPAAVTTAAAAAATIVTILHLLLHITHRTRIQRVMHGLAAGAADQTRTMAPARCRTALKASSHRCGAIVAACVMQDMENPYLYCTIMVHAHAVLILPLVKRSTLLRNT